MASQKRKAAYLLDDSNPTLLTKRTKTGKEKHRAPTTGIPDWQNRVQAAKRGSKKDQLRYLRKLAAAKATTTKTKDKTDKDTVPGSLDSRSRSNNQSFFGKEHRTPKEKLGYFSVSSPDEPPAATAGNNVAVKKTKIWQTSDDQQSDCSNGTLPLEEDNNNDDVSDASLMFEDFMSAEPTKVPNPNSAASHEGIEAMSTEQHEEEPCSDLEWDIESEVQKTDESEQERCERSYHGDDEGRSDGEDEESVKNELQEAYSWVDTSQSDHESSREFPNIPDTFSVDDDDSACEENAEQLNDEDGVILDEKDTVTIEKGEGITVDGDFSFGDISFDEDGSITHENNEVEVTDEKVEELIIDGDFSFGNISFDEDVSITHEVNEAKVADYSYQEAGVRTESPDEEAAELKALTVALVGEIHPTIESSASTDPGTSFQAKQARKLAKKLRIKTEKDAKRGLKTLRYPDLPRDLRMLPEELKKALKKLWKREHTGTVAALPTLVTPPVYVITRTELKCGGG